MNTKTWTIEAATSFAEQLRARRLRVKLDVNGDKVYVAVDDPTEPTAAYVYAATDQTVDQVCAAVLGEKRAAARLRAAMREYERAEGENQ